MVVSSASCVPGASARVTVSTLGDIQTLHVEATGLPEKTTFTLFVIQVPQAPFGLAWYQGDIDTDSQGVGVGNFTGIFSIETFIVAPGVAPAPRYSPKMPAAILPRPRSSCITSGCGSIHLTMLLTLDAPAQ
jgi:hypothetical protein